MKCSALFLLVAAALSGCTTDGWIRGGRRPQEDAEVLHYRKLFEAGRRSESKGDIRIACDTYGWLIGRGNRYGEYGLAMLLLRKEPDSREAVKYLLACAKRSSHTSNLFPDSAMDLAFSAAAMAKLAEIAVSEHDRQDIAASLRCMISSIVTPQVKTWAKEMKAGADSAAIYKDAISAVESSRLSREYVKVFKWPEIEEVFMKRNAVGSPSGDAGGEATESQCSVIRFVKSSEETCQYDFEVKLTRSDTFEEAEKVRAAIRRLLVKEFLSANPHDGVDDVRVSFLSWRQLGSAISGSAIVLKVITVRMKYDEMTHSGKIAVRLDGNDVAAARKWALENIAELATGKHIALVVGEPPPPGASFKIGNECMTEDGLLEIEFTTE